MESNIKSFLLQNSLKEGLFIYSKDGYRYTKGRLRGLLISEVKVSYYQEQLDALEEIFYETESYHTKMVIKDIIKLYYPEKLKRDQY